MIEAAPLAPAASSPTVAPPVEAPPPLLEAFTPALFARNPFRILGVPPAATAREVEREVERRRMMAEFGADGSAPAAGNFPALQPSVDGDEMREARQRISQPEERMVAEFLWFWPLPAGAGTAADRALELVREGDLSGATELWQQAQADPRTASVARHNLALAWQARALEAGLEKTPPPLPAGDGKAPPPQISATERWWGAAIDQWRSVLADEELWGHVAERIRQIDDPQLTTGFARRLREGLPQALVRLHAQLGLRYVEHGASPEAAHMQARLVERYGFSRDLVHWTLEEFIAPVKQRIEQLCAAAEAEATSENGLDIAQRLMSDARPLLGVMDSLLPEDNFLRTRSHDQVAHCGLNCAADHINANRLWNRGLNVLNPLLAIAAGAAAKERIQKNVFTLHHLHEERMNAERCWFCRQAPGIEGRAIERHFHRVTGQQGNTVSFQTRTVKVPRCVACGDRHRQWSWVALGIFFAVYLLAGLLGNLVTSSGAISVLGVSLGLAACAVYHLRRWRNSPIRPEKAWREHPFIRQAFSDGFVAGAKPHNVQ